MVVAAVKRYFITRGVDAQVLQASGHTDLLDSGEQRSGPKILEHLKALWDQQQRVSAASKLNLLYRRPKARHSCWEKTSLTLALDGRRLRKQAAHVRCAGWAPEAVWTWAKGVDTGRQYLAKRLFQKKPKFRKEELQTLWSVFKLKRVRRWETNATLVSSKTVKRRETCLNARLGCAWRSLSPRDGWAMTLLIENCDEPCETPPCLMALCSASSRVQALHVSLQSSGQGNGTRRGPCVAHVVAWS